MSEEYFLDTNILIYAFDRSQPSKRKTAEKLIVQGVRESRAIINWQVAQEFLSLATKKFKKALNPNEVDKILNELLRPLWKVSPTPELFQDSLHINKISKYSFYDSLILASAKAARCGVIYSEDFQHNQVVEDVRIMNPFI